MSDWFRNVPRLIPLCCMGITVAGMTVVPEVVLASSLLERQLVWIMLAWPGMFLMTWIPWRRFRHWGPALFLICLGLLIAVLFLPPINGSRRWIPLGLMDFQPSEPTRLAFIMALASWLMYRESQQTVLGLFVPFLITVLPLLLILREPDLGTALLFVAGARIQHLIVAAVLGIVLLPVLWQQMTAEQKSRIVMLFNQTDGGPQQTGDGFHLYQSKQVLALGGVWGSVWHNEPVTDDPTAWRLPAARTDFVLSIIGERYGLPGIATVLLLYLVLIQRGLQAALRTQEPWARLVAVGIVTMIAVQAIINSSMTVGLMPITGMTLPLCSYGGSSLLSFSIAVGLLMNIAMRPGYEVAPTPFE